MNPVRQLLTITTTLLVVATLWFPAGASAEFGAGTAMSLNAILKVDPGAEVRELYPISSNTPVRSYEDIQGYLLVRANAASVKNHRRHYLCGYDFDNIGGVFQTTCLPVD